MVAWTIMGNVAMVDFGGEVFAAGTSDVRDVSDI